MNKNAILISSFAAIFIAAEVTPQVLDTKVSCIKTCLVQPGFFEQSCKFEWYKVTSKNAQNCIFNYGNYDERNCAIKCDPSGINAKVNCVENCIEQPGHFEHNCQLKWHTVTYDDAYKCVNKFGNPKENDCIKKCSRWIYSPWNPK